MTQWSLWTRRPVESGPIVRWGITGAHALRPLRRDGSADGGWEYLARIFDQTAANELAHAEQFLEKLQQHGKQPIENIDVAAGYPFTHGVTMENLYEAAHSEEQGVPGCLSGVRRRGQRKGSPDVAALWEQIAKIEGCTATCSAGVQPDADRHAL